MPKTENPGILAFTPTPTHIRISAPELDAYFSTVNTGTDTDQIRK